MEWACASCTHINIDIDDCSACGRRNQSPSSLPCFVIEESGRVSISDEKRIVLIGRTGSGKSCTGNTILGGSYFNTAVGCSSITRQCELAMAERFGHKLHVVDTPGLFDTGMTIAQTTKEVVKCIEMTSPGPHAIVLVTRIDRFTQEEHDTVEYFKEVFGEDMTRYLFVLFTRKDDLDAEGVDVHTFIENVPQMLKDILQECNMRYIAFNNRLPLPEQGTQVKELLSMIECNVRANGGRHYTNEMYRQAEEAMVRREAAIREELEGEKCRERERIEREFEEKYRNKLRNKEEVIDITESDIQKGREANVTNEREAMMKTQEVMHGKENTDSSREARQRVRRGVWEGLRSIFF